MEKGEKYLQRRCPRLGGPVSFHYCKTCESQQQACWKIIDCWWEVFDVVRYLQDTLPPEQFNCLVAKKPKSKVTSLIDNIEHARKRLNRQGE
jgi:hypothetical protein